MLEHTPNSEVGKIDRYLKQTQNSQNWCIRKVLSQFKVEHKKLHRDSRHFDVLTDVLFDKIFSDRAIYTGSGCVKEFK